MAKGTKPDYHLYAKGTTADGRELNGQIGAAWVKKGKYGEYIAIKLNPCIVIDVNRDGLLLTLFKPGKGPADGEEPVKKKKPRDEDDDEDDEEGDIPF